MSSTGNPETEISAPPAATEDAPKQRRGWGLLALGLAGLALGLAVVIGTQVIGVLYAIIAPPGVPVPPGEITQMSYENRAYGVDEWLYGTSQNPCAVLAFYQQGANECRIAPGICSGDVVRPQTTFSPGDNVGQCSGTSTFSIFAQRWRVNIATGYPSDETPTRFRLSREIYWTGTVPEIPPDALR